MCSNLAWSTGLFLPPGTKTRAFQARLRSRTSTPTATARPRTVPPICAPGAHGTGWARGLAQLHCQGQHGSANADASADADAVRRAGGRQHCANDWACSGRSCRARRGRDRRHAPQEAQRAANRGLGRRRAGKHDHGRRPNLSGRRRHSGVRQVRGGGSGGGDNSDDDKSNNNDDDKTMTQHNNDDDKTTTTRTTTTTTTNRENNKQGDRRTQPTRARRPSSDPSCASPAGPLLLPRSSGGRRSRAGGARRRRHRDAPRSVLCSRVKSRWGRGRPSSVKPSWKTSCWCWVLLERAEQQRRGNDQRAPSTEHHGGCLNNLSRAVCRMVLKHRTCRTAPLIGMPADYPPGT